jgi:hypothetical protein
MLKLACAIALACLLSPPGNAQGAADAYDSVTIAQHFNVAPPLTPIKRGSRQRGGPWLMMPNARVRTFVSEPPAQFVRAYGGPLVQRVLPIGQARAACAQRGVRADACSWVAKGTCHIVIPSSGAPVKDLAAYRRHEIAHCNGWTH